MDDLKILDCTENDKGAILEIFNDAIVNSTALYDYQPRTLNSMDNWFNSKRAGKFPVIGAYNEKNELLGFSSYGTFRNFPAYKYTVEHSVYVKGTFRGKGIGIFLLKEIINRAQEQQYHTLIGCIDAQNLVSINLHKKMGFEFCGTIKQAGFKFGKWLDIVFYQLLLQTPECPNEN